MGPCNLRDGSSIWDILCWLGILELLNFGYTGTYWGVKQRTWTSYHWGLLNQLARGVFGNQLGGGGGGAKYLFVRKLIVISNFFSGITH